MKILGLNGSERKLGNTEILVKEALMGVEEEGAQVRLPGPSTPREAAMNEPKRSSKKWPINGMVGSNVGIDTLSLKPHSKCLRHANEQRCPQNQINKDEGQKDVLRPYTIPDNSADESQKCIYEHLRESSDSEPPTHLFWWY